MCVLCLVLQLLFQGPEVSGAALRAVLDCLAGYAGVKNLCCWGCCLGDEVSEGSC